MLRAHKGGPRGPPILAPSPLLTPKLGLWMGRVTSLLPFACCGGHFPPSVYPFPPAADSAQMPARPTWA
ncbi:hypothetical protein PBY51_010713 [Eleginops maclovinus]|uniref:Uncharacterized protein n=1 Tax=Eleginops maclovinus TaxID=56733 RepID=A0AAN7XB80_ELEMC|nr:hypothetical protein PBY51_010713 [Eleginops maclovinus]